MAKSKHITDKEIKKLHKQGACLTRHQRRSKGNKCSHQWQAQVKAEDDPDVYNYPKYKMFCADSNEDEFKTAASYKTKNDEITTFPKGYGDYRNGAIWRKRPTHDGKEWDVGNGNFERFDTPYWHNAHHIVPNKALDNEINKAGEKDARIINVVKKGLLQASYNLNDKINMIILPMEKIVGGALGLPRHLKRGEVGPNEKKEYRSHKDYSREVEQLLRTIIKDYKQQIVGKECKEDRDRLSKERIDDLSKDIYDQIIEQGKTLGGADLSRVDMSKVDVSQKVADLSNVRF